MKMLHLVFKVSSTCSHTHLKSLSPLSNCFINYELVKLVPFFSNPASLIPCVWLQAEDTLNRRCNIYHLIFLYRNFTTQHFEIGLLLFCSVDTGCFVEYNACYYQLIISHIISFTMRIVKFT